ncbi:GMC oxidoreductase [Aestuariivirga sp.]|uniref:GMC oxidoreductase n=1 Tax=Aestuariivirga sp. TaxID=2650926 RepID=UPI0039E41D64
MPLAVGYEHRGGDLAPSFQVDVDALRPESRGWVKLRSADPSAAPVINPNYLMEERDRVTLREAVRLTREIFAQKAFDPFRSEELAPGAHCVSDEEIDAYVQQTAESAYHPSCTCRMGADDRAVVDSHCRVRGIEALRVVDASIMPSVVSGNLNGPVFMIAERAADLILGRPVLPPESPPVFMSPSWQTAQR